MVADRSRRIALISIHPRHAEAILDGRKEVELRRAPLAPETTHAVIYATAPTSAVVGWFEIESIEIDTKTAIWDRFGPLTCVSRAEHREYFAGATRAVAIRVRTAQKLDRAIPLSAFGGVSRPPQSFQYLDPSDAARLVIGLRTDTRTNAAESDLAEMRSSRAPSAAGRSLALPAS
jgi:predicted transcriptional regulator